MELMAENHGAIVHRMSLNEEPFEKMLRGVKTIEVRCNDEKRQKIKVNDMILFQLVNHKDKYIIARVKALYPVPTFHELYSAFDFSEFGCTGYTMEQMLKETAEIYSAEKELKYGALGIRVEKIGGNEK